MIKPRKIKPAHGQIILCHVFDVTGDLVDFCAHSSMEKAMLWADNQDIEDGATVNFCPTMVDDPGFGTMLCRLQ